LAGAAAGAIYGAVAITAYLLVDRLFFGGRDSAGMGLTGVVLLGVVAGGFLGAVVGAVTTATGSTGAGIATSAVILGLLKSVGMSLMGHGGGMTALSFVVGAVYGGIVGLAVAGATAKSVKSA
jgi:hypothetical protein